MQNRNEFEHQAVLHIAKAINEACPDAVDKVIFDNRDAARIAIRAAVEAGIPADDLTAALKHLYG